MLTRKNSVLEEQLRFSSDIIGIILDYLFERHDLRQTRSFKVPCVRFGMDSMIWERLMMVIFGLVVMFLEYHMLVWPCVPLGFVPVHGKLLFWIPLMNNWPNKKQVGVMPRFVSFHRYGFLLVYVVDFVTYVNDLNF